MEPTRPKPVQDPRVPHFPVIEANPSLEQIRQALRPGDMLSFGFVSLSSFFGGYHIPDASVSKVMRKRACLGAGLFGTLGGCMMLHLFGKLRLQGFSRNDTEIAKFQHPKLE